MSNMTVGILREWLMGLPDDMRVCCSGDPEGNRYYSNVDLNDECAFNFDECEAIHPSDEEEGEEYVFMIWPSYPSRGVDEI